MTLYPLRDDTCQFCLPMHEGSGNKFYDHSRYDRDAIGAWVWVLDDFFGQYVPEFTGVSSSYAHIDDVSLMEEINKAKEMTFTVWFKTSYTDDVQYIFSSAKVKSGEEGVAAKVLTDGTVSFLCPYRFDVRGEKETNDGEWHFLAVTADYNYARIYVDGELDGESTVWSNWSLRTDRDFLIATHEHSASSQFFKGYQSEFRCYNRILSLEEIRALELYYRNFEVRPSILCPRPTL